MHYNSLSYRGDAILSGRVGFTLVWWLTIADGEYEVNVKLRDQKCV